jgi:hypothetical protein
MWSTLLKVKEPTIIVGQPTYATLVVLRRESYTSACAVHSSLRGGGTHGHLGLIEPPADYLLHAAQPFIAPVHPGIAPDHGLNPTQAIITEGNRKFAAAVVEFATYINVTNEALKKSILHAVDDKYLAILSNNIMGYADVICCDMMAHLLDT